MERGEDVTRCCSQTLPVATAQLEVDSRAVVLKLYFFSLWFP